MVPVCRKAQAQAENEVPSSHAPRRTCPATHLIALVHVEADVVYEPGHGGDVAAQAGHVQSGVAVLRAQRTRWSEIARSAGR